MAYLLTKAAQDQIEAVLIESVRQHGPAAADRYGELILVIMEALGSDAALLGSAEVPHLPGVRVYSTRLGRRRVEAARRVGSPRHLIVYRLASDDVVEIFGLVHDRMVLSRAARKLVKGADAG